MRNLVLTIVAATSLLGATAATAQSVEFNAGPRHPGVYLGDRDHDRYRDRDWRRSHNEWRGDRDVVVIKKHRHWDHGRFDGDRD
jgi:Ni/Co efflux regulator RcnB